MQKVRIEFRSLRACVVWVDPRNGQSRNISTAVRSSKAQNSLLKSYKICNRANINQLCFF